MADRWPDSVLGFPPSVTTTMVLTTEATSNRPGELGVATGRKPLARPTLAEERKLWKAGHLTVAGLDEVGRGAWAGPVSVGVAVVRTGITTRNMSPWLRDSKQLSEDRREEIFDEIGAWCAEWAVGHVEAHECDRWGMTAALRVASLRALSTLKSSPDALLVDGPHDLLAPPASKPVQPSLGQPFDTAETGQTIHRAVTEAELPRVDLPRQITPVVKGDARCASIAAASIMAKVVRDRLMRSNAIHFPAFSFEHNKGYPSPVHQTALRGYGLSSIHRRSWAFVGDLPWRDGVPSPTC
jgi:ribonuclease HII